MNSRTITRCVDLVLYRAEKRERAKQNKRHTQGNENQAEYRNKNERLLISFRFLGLLCFVSITKERENYYMIWCVGWKFQVFPFFPQTTKNSAALED